MMLLLGASLEAYGSLNLKTKPSTPWQVSYFESLFQGNFAERGTDHVQGSAKFKICRDVQLLQALKE